MATSKRGFAKLKETNPELMSRIAQMGGRRAHQLGRAHEFTPEEGKRAGQLGGKARHQNEQYFHELASSSSNKKVQINTNNKINEN